jgi:hypothetical protein
MPDTTASGVQMPDTDFIYYQMVQQFNVRATAAADAVQGQNTAAAAAFQKLMSDTMAQVSIQMTGLGMIHAQWLGQFASLQASITAAAMNLIASVGSDNAVEMIKMGAALANSASPPTPGYQNLGPQYPGGPAPTPTPGTVTLPKGSTVTVPAT